MVNARLLGFWGKEMFRTNPVMVHFQQQLIQDCLFDRGGPKHSVTICSVQH